MVARARKNEVLVDCVKSKVRDRNPFAKFYHWVRDCLRTQQEQKKSLVNELGKDLRE